MARIAETEIERLKNEVSVERLIEDAGIALKKAGKDLLGCCPFHEDATASLVVTPAKNLWHCFGCGVGGGPIDWVMRKNGVSFRHAVELLREGISSLVAGVVKQSTIRALPAPVVLDADDRTLLNQVIDYYHETLKQSPEALAYLKSRGLDHPELIDRFKLGFANRTLGLRLPEKTRVAGEAIRVRLQKIGVFRESGHEHFNGSLVVPVIDEAGHVTEVYGRKITDNLRPGTPLHLYLPGPHRGIWNMDALQASKEIILCEALIDAMTFWCAGYRNVTASYGIDGFTEDHLSAMKRYGTERVLIAYDRDEAGERGAEKVAELLQSAGLDCFRIQFPKGMDANEYALKVAPASKSLGVAIRKAMWLGKGTAPMEPAIAETTISAMASTDDTPAPSLAASTPIDEATLPASPLPATALEIPIEQKDNEIVMTLGDRRYRVRGFVKNLSVDVMKVNVLVSRGDAFHVDSLDLYSAKQRASYTAQAAVELRLKDDIIKTDLGRVLMKLETLQDEQLREVLASKSPATPSMSDAAREAALALLRAPDLVERILTDFDACGCVGEKTNKLIGYLAAVSRKLDAPLALIVQSSSAAGKSSLMDAVLAFVPEEERVKYSAMTGQSLFYMGETNLKHKILAICEEEGIARATYALKVLQSDGELTIASTGKDASTGNLITQEYRVEGPVMLMLTTTSPDLHEELQNRCLILTVDEGREQTEAIHRLQRQKRTLGGLQAKQAKARVIELHQNAQRLLRPLAVLNPYADQLTFLSDKTRTRRDHEKYLTLIDAIALLHQHQREKKSLPGHGGALLEYIEVTLADIAAANTIAHEVLGHSLDELPPVTRRLLREIVRLVEARAAAQQIARHDVRFSRREVREGTGWSDTQLRVHLERLVSMEYVLTHRGGRGQSFEYELLYDGDGSNVPHLSGLLDVATISTSRGNEGRFAGSSRGQNGADAAPSPNAASTEIPSGTSVSEESVGKHSTMHIMRTNSQDLSYPHAVVAASHA